MSVIPRSVAALLVCTSFARVATAAPCDAEDAPCLRVELREQAERAELAEQRVDVLKQSLEVAERIGKEEHDRAETWKHSAESVGADRSSSFWFTGGFVFGALVVGVVAYGLASSSR